jgi:phospholipid/cholesterol/gamma-HCH transport system substrate-binding protein
METRVNYTLVGLLVLLLGTAAIIIPLWLASGLDRQQYNTYVVYMNESVDGLSTNSSVKYNGVDVGFVRDIQLNLANTQQVKILLNIKQGIPITTNTTAVLRNQGITGVEYIGLNGGKTAGAKPLLAKSGEPYPVIPAAPSIMLKLDAALTQLMHNMSKMSDQMNLVFNPDNAKLFTNTLTNIDHITGNIAKGSPQYNIALRNISQSTQNMPDITAQMQLLLQSLQVITNEIKENPSVIVRGKANPPLGPGERKE